MANSQEYGFFQMLDMGLLNPNEATRVSDAGLVTSGILYDNAKHNADLDALLQTYAITTNDYTEEIQVQGSSRNQPVDEHGRALPIKPLPPYTVAYPIQGSGSAIGMNWIVSNQITNREMARTLTRMYRGDYAWVRDHVYGSLFDNVGYSFRDPTGKGALAVKGLANGDAVTYYKTGSGANEADTHYLAQAAAIADNANPYLTLKDELLEHPDNSGEVIAFISTSLVATTAALTEFHTIDIDPDITVPSDEARLVGSLGITLPPFSMVKGKTDSGVWIVEQTDLPAGYIVALTTGGDKPLARRQFAEAALQGFKPAGERQDFPYFETQWQRWEGYGARNRAGAAVIRIGNGSYAVPTNFTVPMP